MKLLEQDDPILREIAEPVSESEFSSPWLKKLINTMLKIMKDECAVGVAAPQIGISKRVIVFGTSYTQSRKITNPIPDTVLINPSLKILSQKTQVGGEGCLNCTVRGDVTRAMEIEYSGYDFEGHFFTKKATELEARIIQHEIDHLEGILFIDRVEDPTTLIPYEEPVTGLNP